MINNTFKVFTVSSVLDDTPEGQFRMDRLRHAAEAERANLPPGMRDLLAELEYREDCAFLQGST